MLYGHFSKGHILDEYSKSIHSLRDSATPIFHDAAASAFAALLGSETWPYYTMTPYKCMFAWQWLFSAWADADLHGRNGARVEKFHQEAGDSISHSIFWLFITSIVWCRSVNEAAYFAAHFAFPSYHAPFALRPCTRHTWRLVST